MYKILSLDGGGIHGYSTLTILKRITEKRPDLIDKVDLIAGTSIGGILGLGLGLNHDISYVEENFIKGVPLAFKTNAVRLAGFVAGLCAKYDNSKFKRFLDKVYGPTKLKDLDKNVLVTSFCIDNEKPLQRRWKAKIFHNFKGNDNDGEARILDAALATSAAPIFFPTYDKYLDGAIIANNPTLCAIAQTQDHRAEIDNRPTLNDIAVLSIGSIRNIYIPDRDMSWGYFMWSRSIFHLITESGLLVTDYICDKLIKDRYNRICPVINNPMDDFRYINDIKTAGESYPLDKTFDWLDKYWN